MLINGEEVLNGFDILAAAGGCFRGTVREFIVQAGGQVTLELRKSDNAKLGPMINGLELVAKELKRVASAK